MVDYSLDYMMVPAFLKELSLITHVVYKMASYTRVHEYITSTPKSHRLREVPDSSDYNGTYTIRLVMDEIVRVRIECMKDLSHPPGDAQGLLLPTWISPEQKVMYLKQYKYHKAYLVFVDGSWRFSCRRQNGTEKWGEVIKYLKSKQPDPR